jgi:hypothetical protein
MTRPRCDHQRTLRDMIILIGAGLFPLGCIFPPAAFSSGSGGPAVQAARSVDTPRPCR